MVRRARAGQGGVGARLLGATYLDPYITSAWNAYTSKTLTVVPAPGDQPNVKYSAARAGTPCASPTRRRRRSPFSKPSSADVWGCDGNLHAPNDQVVGPIARTLCAASTAARSAPVDTQPSTNAADFYKSNPTNQYAKAIHAAMADGGARAFAFDDVGAFESPAGTTATCAPRVFVLSLFTGGGTGGGGGGGAR